MGINVEGPTLVSTIVEQLESCEVSSMPKFMEKYTSMPNFTYYTFMYAEIYRKLLS